MSKQGVQPPFEEFWTLVRAQHGVVSRGQLLDLGFRASGIHQRVLAGRLHTVHPGVYAVGRPELSREGRWMAAVLVCGPGALLSHRSGGALLKLGDERPGVIEISVPHSRNPRGYEGILVYRRSVLQPRDISERAGIPVTGILLTLIDIAATGPSRVLEAAVIEADKRGLITPDELRREIGARRGQRGVPALRRLLDRQTFVLTDSELERRFVPIAGRAGLPPPLTQHWVNGFRVDFFWPDLGLVVETDGLRYHRTPAQQARDRFRDQTHTAAGLTPLRFTHAQVRYEGAYVEATLRRTARRLTTS